MLNTGQNNVSLNGSLYGELKGKRVYELTLQNEDVTVEVTNIGCSISAIYTRGRNGLKKNIVAGFSDLANYETNKDYFGCVLGRYANRIGNGRFSLNGKDVNLSVNDVNNHLHGGVEGFNKKIWNVSSFTQNDEKACVVFEYLSKDGEEGYPGNLSVKIKYILTNKNQLIIEYYATTDKATPVSLSNHSYFNLTGFDKPLVTDHLLEINAGSYTEKSKANLPTGKVLPVAGTALDFLTPKKIGDHIGRFPLDKGYDHNFILNNECPGRIVLAATLSEPSSGRKLKLYTSQHALQLYSANFWDGTICGRQGFYYQKHGAVALETQAIPDSPNHPSFPNTILYPGKDYFSTTIYEFGVDGIV